MTRKLVAIICATAAASVGVGVGLAIASDGGAGSRVDRYAPSAKSLPVVSTAKIIASASGGSNVDQATDRRKFRYMAIAGARGMVPGQLVESEADALRNRGWTKIRFQRRIDTGSSRNFPGVHRFGAGGGLSASSRNGKEFADFLLAPTHLVELEETDGSPIYDRKAITIAVRHHLAVAFVVLGWTARH